MRRLQAVLLEKVRPVVDHLKVAVERDRVDVPLEAGAEIAEERRYVAPLQGGVALDAAAEVLEVARGHVVAHPLRVEDRRVVRVRLGRKVGQELLIEVGEGNGDDLDLCAGQPLEVRPAPLQRLGDLRPGESQDADGDAAELVVRGSVRRSVRTGRNDGCGQCKDKGSRQLSAHLLISPINLSGPGGRKCHEYGMFSSLSLVCQAPNQLFSP